MERICARGKLKLCCLVIPLCAFVLSRVLPAGYVAGLFMTPAHLMRGFQLLFWVFYSNVCV